MNTPWRLRGGWFLAVSWHTLHTSSAPTGSTWFSPAAVGPVVALIGLELSGSGGINAGLLDPVIDPKNVTVFLVTLGTAVFGSILFRKFLSVIPILIAVIAGYVAAVACRIVTSARWRRPAVRPAEIYKPPNLI